MALPSTLYRFRIDLSDVDRNTYTTLDFRVAMHPSESVQFLLTRVLAFALNIQEGLEFSPGGLSDPDAPCLRVADSQNSVHLWIEVGSPSARKLHKAAKAATQVKVYTYKDPVALINEILSNKVYHAERIEIFSLVPKFLDRLATTLQRDNIWGLIHTDGQLTVTAGDHSEAGEITRHSV